MKYTIYYCMMVRDSGKVEQGVCAGAEFSLMFAEIILLAIVFPLVNAGEYFVGYCLAICECWRIFCWLLSCH